MRTATMFKINRPVEVRCRVNGERRCGDEAGSGPSTAAVEMKQCDQLTRSVPTVACDECADGRGDETVL